MSTHGPLTPEQWWGLEWGYFNEDCGSLSFPERLGETDGAWGCVQVWGVPNAAAILYSLSFFTHEMVEALERVTTKQENFHNPGDYALCEAAIKNMAALLPPRSK